MSCDYPLYAYRSKHVNPETGKRAMQFRLHGSFDGERIELPCGRCLGCKLERSRSWAMRCMHENKMHAESCFVTLTYNNESLPHNGTLVKSHLQMFHKRLHNRLLDSRGFGIRYYGCGEYGDLNKRPHYHSIIFGYRPADAVIYSRNSRDECIYDSATLSSIWHDNGVPMGAVRFGDVTFESAAYVARYCVKKVSGKKRQEGHYEVYDADGVVSERLPEFAHMSLRPGIGATYFAKYGAEIAAHDNVIVNGRPVPSIRYYSDLVKRLDPLRFDEIQFDRSERVDPSDHTPDRRRVKEVLREKTHAMKRRKI